MPRSGLDYSLTILEGDMENTINFKVGDKVLVTKPSPEVLNTSEYNWHSYLDRYDRLIATVTEITHGGYVRLEHTHKQIYFHHSWLTLVEESGPSYNGYEDSRADTPMGYRTYHFPQKQVDWEQRRWDLVRDLYTHGRVIPIPEVLKCADELIEAYMERLR